MKGTIIKRGERYSVVIDLGRDADGKRIRKWHSGYRTRREAEEARIEILARIQQGEYVGPSKQTLQAFLMDEWVPAIKGSVRPTTWASYKRNIELHVVPHIGSRQVQRLSTSQLNKLYADLLDSGRVDGKGGLSNSTVRYVHRILTKALNDAVKWGKLTRNPCTAAEPPRRTATETELRVWNAEELREFLMSVEDHELYALWMLAATTGMRRGEVLGLRWQDLDLESGRLSVVQTLVSVDYEVQISEPKTSRGRRSIALDPRTVRALRQHRSSQVEARLALGSRIDPSDLVFLRADGSAYHPDGIGKEFKKLQARAELPRIRFHDLRHTHATLALQAGVHPRIVSERLGHSSIAMTLDTYSHVMPNMQEEAAARVSTLLFGDAPI